MHTLRELVLDVPEYLLDGPVRRCLVCEVERGRVDEGELEGLLAVRVVLCQLNIDGYGSEMGGVSGRGVDELCDGGELVLRYGGGKDASVEEETEEGGLAGPPASDHESVGGNGVVDSGRNGGNTGAGTNADTRVDVRVVVVPWVPPLSVHSHELEKTEATRRRTRRRRERRDEGRYEKEREVYVLVGR